METNRSSSEELFLLETTSRSVTMAFPAPNYVRRGTFTWLPSYGDIPVSSLQDYTITSLREYYKYKTGTKAPSVYTKRDIVNVLTQLASGSTGQPVPSFGWRTPEAVASSSNSSGVTSLPGISTIPRPESFPPSVMTRPLRGSRENLKWYNIYNNIGLGRGSYNIDNVTAEQALEAQRWFDTLPGKATTWRMQHPLEQIQPNHNIPTVYSVTSRVLPPERSTAVVRLAQSGAEILSNPVILTIKDNVHPGHTVRKFFQDMGFSTYYNLSDSDMMVATDLMYYYSLISNQVALSLTSTDSREMAYYFNTCSDAILLDLLGPLYQGPRDRASLLFAAHTGQIPEQVPYSEQKFRRLINTDLNQIGWLVSEMYPLITTVPGVSEPIITAVGPYRYLAAQADTVLDYYWYNLSPDNALQTADSIGINLPTALDTAARHPDNTTSQSRTQALVTKLKVLAVVDHWLMDYGTAVFTRQSGLVFPAHPLSEPGALRFFTDRELAYHYELPITLERKVELSEIIANRAVWGFQRFRNATNANEMDVETMELRKDEFVKPGQAILSYGRIGAYHSWTVSELTYTFAPEPDGSYLFRNPSSDSSGFFTLSVIRKLAKFLEQLPGEYISDLLDIITKGLEFHTLVNQNVASLRTKYLQFNQQEQSLITLYIFWLFTFGQYARFWKGPGHPYHVMRMNFEYLPAHRQRPEFCTPFQRNILSTVQLVLYHTILYNLELLPNRTDTKKWVRDLPIVKYDFDLDEAVITASSDIKTVDDLLDKAGNGRLCMMFTSDSAVETAFFLVRRVLGITNLNDFNNTLRTMLPILRQMELDIVRTRISEAEANIRPIEEQLRLLNPLDPTTEARRAELTADLDAANTDEQLEVLRAQLVTLSVVPIPFQEDFDPTQRVETGEHDVESAHAMRPV